MYLLQPLINKKQRLLEHVSAFKRDYNDVAQTELYLQQVAELDKIVHERDNFRQVYKDL